MREIGILVTVTNDEGQKSSEKGGKVLEIIFDDTFEQIKVEEESRGNRIFAYQKIDVDDSAINSDSSVVIEALSVLMDINGFGSAIDFMLNLGLTLATPKEAESKRKRARLP